MATLNSNLKCITSNTVPTVDNLLVGEMAFGKVADSYHLYGNSDGSVQELSGGSMPQPMQPVKKVLWSGTLSVGQGVTLDEDVSQYFPFLWVRNSGSIYMPLTAINGNTIYFGSVLTATSQPITSELIVNYVASTKIFTIVSSHSLGHNPSASHGSLTDYTITEIFTMENQIKAGPIPMDLLKQEILKSVYPIGSTFTSKNPVMPNDIASIGTWQRIQGVFIAATSDTDSSFSLSDTTRGAKTVSLTTSQLPMHNHTTNSFSLRSDGQSASHTHASASHSHAVQDSSGAGKYVQTGTGIGGGSLTRQLTMAADNVANGYANINTTTVTPGPTGNQSVDHTHSITIPTTNTTSIGSNSAHENMPPYITRYIWERIA